MWSRGAQHCIWSMDMNDSADGALGVCMCSLQVARECGELLPAKTTYRRVVQYGNLQTNVCNGGSRAEGTGDEEMTPTPCGPGHLITTDRRMPLATELRLNVAAASAAGFVQPLIFNPLDCLRIRWQVARKSKQGTFTFARDIVAKEGVILGLCLPGQPYNSLAVALSQGLRLGLYPSVEFE